MAFSIQVLDIVKNVGSSIYVFFSYFGQIFSERLYNGNDIPLYILKQNIYVPFTGTIRTVDFSLGTFDDNFINVLNNAIDFLNIPTCEYVYELFLYIAIPLVLLFFTVGILKQVFKFIFQ